MANVCINISTGKPDIRLYSYLFKGELIKAAQSSYVKDKNANDDHSCNRI